MPSIIQSIPRAGTPILARQWANNVKAAGGGFENNSLVIISRFLKVLQSKSYYVKIKYLLPMIGSGVNASRVPLINLFGIGAATNFNFVNSDFAQNLGLTGDGTSKYFDLLISPSTLGAIAGLGFWNMAVITGGDYRCGATDGGESSRYVIDLRTTSERFSYGSTLNAVINNTAAIGAHYYGQQSAIDNRVLYRNGSSIANNLTSDGTAPVSNTMFLMAGNVGGAPASYATGTCGLFYMTNGILSEGEISDFHATLTAYLMSPSGKI